MRGSDLRRCGRFILGGAALILGAAGSPAQTLHDPSFESYAVAAGQLEKPSVGPWLFSNDAGVTSPFAGNSSTGVLHTWSATLAAVEGEKYATTYAGIDSLRQAVRFAAPGAYRLAVYAASPAGTVAISGGPITLGSGEFAFTLNGVDQSPPHATPAGAGWRRYDAMLTIPAPGDYVVGVRNTARSPYFINYDAFSLSAVPEPTTATLAAAAIVATHRACSRRRSTRRTGDA